MIHSFEIEDAEKYGVSEAIVLYNIRYWIRYNKANRLNIHDGRVWTYNSARALAELFPYFTADKIRRYLDNLESDGGLIVGNYNQRPGDRTKWYSLPGEEGSAPKEPEENSTEPLANPPINMANPPHHLANSPEYVANPPHPFGKSAAPLPDINSDIKPNKNANTRDDLEFGMIPEILKNPVRRYRDKLNNLASISSIATKIQIITGDVEHEIIRDCILQIVEESEQPGYKMQYRPDLATLLSDRDKILSRAAKYRHKPKPAEYEPREFTPEAANALEQIMARELCA